MILNNFKQSSFFLSVLSMCFIVMVLIRFGIDHNSTLLNDMWLVALYIIILLITNYIYLVALNIKWHRPFFITLNFFSIYYIFGIVTYYLRDAYYYNYPGDISLVNIIVFFALLILILSYFSVLAISKSYVYKSYSSFTQPKTEDYVRLKYVIAIFGFAGLFSSIIFFDFYRDIPLLSNDIDAARVRIISLRGSYLNGVMLLFHSLALSLLIYYDSRKLNTKLFLSFFLCKFFVLSIPLFFYGGRSMVMIPAILCMLIYCEFKNSISIIKIVITGLLVFIGNMLFAVFRMFGANDFTLYFINAVSADAFPEMRMFAFSNINMVVGEYFTNVFITPLVSIFPSALLDVFGITKSDNWKPIGGVILSNFADAGDILGIRISIIGEIYLGGGFTALFVCMSFLGALLYWADRKLQIKSGIEKYPYIVLTGTLPLLMTYGSLFAATCFFLFFESIFIVRFVKRSEVF